VRLFIYIFLILNTLACREKTPQATAQHDFPTKGSSIELTFKQRFPNAEDIYLDSLETGFEVSFNEGDNDRMAFYDKNRHFLYVTTYIENDSLPPAAQQYVNTKYKNAQLNIINAVEDGKELHYVAELETAENYVVLEFDNKGKLLRESKHPLSKQEMQQREEEGVDDN
jgi:hypothetical protein